MEGKGKKMTTNPGQDDTRSRSKRCWELMSLSDALQRSTSTRDRKPAPLVGAAGLQLASYFNDSSKPKEDAATVYEFQEHAPPPIVILNPKTRKVPIYGENMVNIM